VNDRNAGSQRHRRAGAALGARAWLILLGAACCAPGCGRSSLLGALDGPLPPDAGPPADAGRPPVDAAPDLGPSRCVLTVTPAAVDFGAVAPGVAVVRTVTLANDGTARCQISGIALSAASDATFAMQAGTATTLVLAAGQRATLSVWFSPTKVALPLKRSGTLVFQSNDAAHEKVEVPLAAAIATGCSLAVSPLAVDFGHLALNSDSPIREVTVSNQGAGPCDITNLGLPPSSDPDFFVYPPATFTIAAGQSRKVRVRFDPLDAGAPHHHTATLMFDSIDPLNTSVAVPLSADIDGCDLTISPVELRFGNVMLNATVSGTITVGNDGNAACPVAGIAILLGSDPEFTLAPGQATAFTVPPGGSQSVVVRFTASDSAPPHLKTGTLALQTTSPVAIYGVPLSAYVNLDCVDGSQWIYTVDTTGMFSRFDPAALTFTDIGRLACPSSTTPFSMAVDEHAVAWVLYRDGNLFRVDTGTAACQATSFQVGQLGITQFGMGFVFDPTTGIDSLYVAGGTAVGPLASTLATISFPSLTMSPIGTITAGWPELTGTGDGELWGFVPSFASSTGQSRLLQLDPTNGAVLASFPYTNLTSGGWAVKFWGGSFWIFLGSSIYEVSRATPEKIVTAVVNTGRNIVGAGVSTCAPVQSLIDER
jgi:centrosomal CEP192-like protein